MPVLTYRALDPNGDPLMGRGQVNFLTDLEAVAQSILTAIRLFQGEWWENTNAGTPLFQSMLGTTNGRRPEIVSLLLTQRILSRPYVTRVLNARAGFDSAGRAFTFSCQVQTQFGTIAVSA